MSCRIGIDAAVNAERVRKKRLGQFFTGRSVGRLLAALAQAEDARSVIDPMVGSGDLLAAALEVGARPKTVVGFDLDSVAIDKAGKALRGTPGLRLHATDAFAAKIPIKQFDLVIGNPPYIRYQSRGELDGVLLPSADSVRSHLIAQIEGRAKLAPEARSVFLEAARTYPDTSDVGVPAWILSAALVAEGGRLALVVPAAWLSRNYAQPIRDVIDKAFDVEVIVEDQDASWFDDAQVRTQLFVARRRAIGATSGHSVIVASAGRELSEGDSLIGTLESEHVVASRLRALTEERPTTVTRGLSASAVSGISFAARGEGGFLASRMGSIPGMDGDRLPFRTLESYGWRCGQGLRTGANEFFYLTEEDGHIRPAPRWGLASLDFPKECLEPAVRRQSDLDERLVVTGEASLASRVLNLRGWVTTEDLGQVHNIDGRVLPREVSEWIGRVANTPSSKTSSSKKFRELSAVATNVKWDDRGRPAAFWYQLPPLVQRHRPALFMPRVCGGRPVAYRNTANVLIDANFSTLWQFEDDALPADAVFALLNSTWMWANLEVACAVLGGGALKVEATDLRRAPIPRLDPPDISRLAKLGKRLRSAADSDLLEAIDFLVEAILSGGKPTAGIASSLKKTAEQRLRSRLQR